MAAYKLKDSGIYWLGEIPEHWRIRKLKRDFDVLLGKMIQPEQRREHDKKYSYLRAANIDWTGVKINDVKTMWFQPFEVKKYALKKADLLVSEGGDVGKSSLWNDELNDCFYQNAINRVRAKQSNDTRFLYYWIYFLKHIGFVDSIVNRITIAHLTAEKLEALPILICPPIEQKAIAHYLDQACQNIDKTIHLKQQQLEKLTAYRKSVIHEAVTKGLDKTVTMKDSGVDWLGTIPEHWRARKLKRNFDVLLGKMIQPEQKREHDKEYSYLRAANIDWIGVKTNDVKTMWFQPFEVKKYALKREDLLVSEGGDVGKSSLWNNELKDCFYQNAINRVRAKQSNSTQFLYYWIYFLKHVGFIDSIVNRITIAHLTAEKLEYLPILICPPSEQKAIADYLDQACQNIDKTKESLSEQIKTLTQYRQSLIHECVTGKKRVYFADMSKGENHAIN